MNAFARGYIECALWAETDNSTESGGEPFDKNYSEDDLAPETVRKMVEDCDRFREAAAEELRASGLSDESAGHNFWLTRNRHGTGFWDRDLPGDLGDKLTEIAESFGECDLYVGDDGLIYIL